MCEKNIPVSFFLSIFVYFCSPSALGHIEFTKNKSSFYTQVYTTLQRSLQVSQIFYSYNFLI